MKEKIKRKLIVIREETYNDLKDLKVGDESFNSLFSRIIKSIRDGKWESKK